MLEMIEMAPPDQHSATRMLVKMRIGIPKHLFASIAGIRILWDWPQVNEPSNRFPCMIFPCVFVVRPEAKPAISSAQRAGADARARCGWRAHLVEQWRSGIEFSRRIRQRPEQLRRECGLRSRAARGIRSVRVARVSLS